MLNRYTYLIHYSSLDLKSMHWYVTYNLARWRPMPPIITMSYFSEKIKVFHVRHEYEAAGRAAIWALALNSNGVVHPSGGSTQWAELKALALTPSHSRVLHTRNDRLWERRQSSPQTSALLVGRKKRSVTNNSSKFYRHHISKVNLEEAKTCIRLQASSASISS